jgi:hypothetical protein
MILGENHKMVSPAGNAPAYSPPQTVRLTFRLRTDMDAGAGIDAAYDLGMSQI